MSNSISVKIKPIDSRCRYWCKVIRSGTPLPDPSAVKFANDLPGEYSRRGDEELFPGDVMIEGEANHHRNERGWTYTMSYVGDDPENVARLRPNSETKAVMKRNGLPPHLLTGAGEIAACVRVIHAMRLGVTFVEPQA